MKEKGFESFPSGPDEKEEQELFDELPRRGEEGPVLKDIPAKQVIFANPDVIPGLLATVKDELELQGVHEEDAEKATMGLPERFQYNEHTGGLVIPFETVLEGKPYVYKFRVDHDPNDWQMRQ